MITTVLLYTFLGVAAIQIIYYLFFSVFAFAKKTDSGTQNLPDVSVLICAKNESENLRKNIPSILEQEYPNFELVLINDASTDDTLQIMESFKKNSNKIKIVNVEENENFWRNKKYALTLGIKAAKHDYLLFTDADCKPASNKWIYEMASNFSSNKSFVLGYGKYQSKRNSFVNLLVRYETLLTAIQYFSYALLKNPYMAVGRNLAYKKDEFFKTKGFINHIQVCSGDDDLFIQEAADRHNTTINFNPQSFTTSTPPSNFKQWFRQKRRHVSTAHHYRLYHKILLGLFFMSKFLFWILFPITLVLSNYYIPLSAFALYIVVSYVIVGFSASKLKESKTLYFLPFLELFLVLSQFAIFSTNLIQKPTHWK